MVSDGRTIKRLVIVVTIRCMFVMVALGRNECHWVTSGRASDCACRTMPNSHTERLPIRQEPVETWQ